MNDIQVGDEVFLISGGPRMTVVQNLDYDLVVVGWFTSDNTYNAAQVDRRAISKEQNHHWMVR